MYISKMLLASVVLTIVCAACNPTDYGTTPDTLALLTSGKWQMTSMTWEGETETASNHCDSDNTYTLTKNGKITMDEGATKCNDTDPQTIVGIWTFANAEKKQIHVNLPNIDALFQIVSMDSKTLQCQYIEDQKQTSLSWAFAKIQ
jgi:hypothetical protein